ncbi:MAG: peptidoglycan-associated lipoprotein [Deltaproteobacteria bacterium HGW-Deltaproteobacteria-10]|nr:MAG: peptidoglycan-associated lipoprotein [Deltaproteobacteria bacterium HGW-Deltaproteobacteria-10]
MKKNLTWVGLLIVLVFSLSIFAGCAEKKAVVKEGAAQDQQVSSDQAAKDAAAKAEADRLAREQAEKDRLAREQAEKEQSARVQAAATAEVTVKDIYFDFDKSNIRPDAREVLKANADYFLKNSAAAIIVEGHCDERGTAEYNMALGQRRAQEAKKYLVNLGVKGSAIKTISYGKERPVDQGHDEQAWAKNRRAHFAVKAK